MCWTAITMVPSCIIQGRLSTIDLRSGIFRRVLPGRFLPSPAHPACHIPAPLQHAARHRLTSYCHRLTATPAALYYCESYRQATPPGIEKADWVRTALDITQKPQGLVAGCDEPICLSGRTTRYPKLTAIQRKPRSLFLIDSFLVRPSDPDDWLSDDEVRPIKASDTRPPSCSLATSIYLPKQFQAFVVIVRTGFLNRWVSGLVL